MSFSPLPQVRARFLDENANPLSGGRVATFIAGTSNPTNTYTDSTGSTANTNPVILDSEGYADIWLNINVNYKITLQDSNGAEIWSVDNIQAGGSGGGGGINTDEFVKISNSDIQAQYLADKLVAGSNISLVVESAAGVETLRVSLDGELPVIPDPVIDGSFVIKNIDGTYVVTDGVNVAPFYVENGIPKIDGAGLRLKDSIQFMDGGLAYLQFRESDGTGNRGVIGSNASGVFIDTAGLDLNFTTSNVKVNTPINGDNPTTKTYVDDAISSIDLSNLVTTDTAQDIDAEKNFTENVSITGIGKSLDLFDSGIRFFASGVQRVTWGFQAGILALTSQVQVRFGSSVGIDFSSPSVDMTGVGSVTVPTPSLGAEAVNKDYADSLVSTTPDLQQVTNEGSTTTNLITANGINVTDGTEIKGTLTADGDDLLITSPDGGIKVPLLSSDSVKLVGEDIDGLLTDANKYLALDQAFRNGSDGEQWVDNFARHMFQQDGQRKNILGGNVVSQTETDLDLYPTGMSLTPSSGVTNLPNWFSPTGRMGVNTYTSWVGFRDSNQYLVQELIDFDTNQKAMRSLDSVNVWSNWEPLTDNQPFVTDGATGPESDVWQNGTYYMTITTGATNYPFTFGLLFGVREGNSRHIQYAYERYSPNIYFRYQDTSGDTWSAWALQSGNFVTLDTTQTITGAKTLTKDLTLGQKIVLQAYVNPSAVNGDIWFDGSRTQVKSPLGVNNSIINYSLTNGISSGILDVYGSDASISGKLYVGLRQFSTGARIYSGASALAQENPLAFYIADSSGVEQNSLDLTHYGLNLKSRTNSSPEDGDIWYDGTNLKGREGGVTSNLIGGSGGSIIKTGVSISLANANNTTVAVADADCTSGSIVNVNPATFVTGLNIRGVIPLAGQFLIHYDSTFAGALNINYTITK